MPVDINGNGIIYGLDPLNIGIGNWSSYIPTISNNWSIGNGVANSKYTQIGNTVIYSGSITIGSTTTIGTTMIRISIPVPASEDAMADNYNWGVAYLFDSSATGRNVGVAQITGAGDLGIWTYYLASVPGYPVQRSVTSTQPFTWAVNDYIKYTICYEAA